MTTVYQAITVGAIWWKEGALVALVVGILMLV